MLKDTPSDLYLLIKSMSRNEKGYFQKYFNHDTNNNKKKYVELYEIIENSKSTDERQIQKYFREKYNERNFSSLKRYLFNTLLDALSNFHNNKFVDAQIHKIIDHSQVLFSRGFYKRAKKEILKASEISERYELYYYLLITIDFLIRLEVQSQKLLSKDEVKRLLLKRKNILGKIQDIEYYNYLSRSISSSFANNELNREHLKGKAEAILKKLPKPSLEKEDSVTVSFEYFKLIFVCQSALDNDDEAFAANKQKIETVKRKPILLKIANWQRLYYIALNNYIAELFYRKKLNKAESSLKDLNNLYRQTSEANTKLIANIFAAYYTLNIELFIKKGMQNEAISFIESEQKIFDKHQPNFIHFHKTRVPTIMVLLYFTLGKHDTALNFINEVLSQKKVETRLLIIIMLRVMEVIIHVDLENKLLLPSLLLSLKRLMGKNEQKLVSVNIMIDGFLKYTNCKNSSDEKSIFENMLQLLASDKILDIETNFIDDIVIIPFLKYKLNDSHFRKEVIAYFASSQNHSF